MLELPEGWKTIRCHRLLEMCLLLWRGELAKNMHCRSKEHVSKFNSKSEKIRAESAFYKHLVNTHDGKSADKNFADYFEIQILKAYRKPFTRLVEEGTFISSHKGELLNSKN